MVIYGRNEGNGTCVKASERRRRGKRPPVALLYVGKRQYVGYADMEGLKKGLERVAKEPPSAEGKRQRDRAERKKKIPGRR